MRKTLIEADYVDCVVQLTGQLFANTQIPCCLWFLSKSRGGGGGFRKRTGEILFIDGRKLGTLIPGSRKQKQLAPDREIERVASVYRSFRRDRPPEEIAGFCKTVGIAEIQQKRYVLPSGRVRGSRGRS